MEAPLMVVFSSGWAIPLVHRCPRCRRTHILPSQPRATPLPYGPVTVRCGALTLIPWDENNEPSEPSETNPSNPPTIDY
jgi:hypothetical protein